MAFRITLTEGIVGGFKPATIRRMISIADENGEVIVRSSTLKSRDDYNVMQGTLTSQQVGTLVNDLKVGLNDLPTEMTSGGQDIYGMDTSISFQSNDFEWRNGGSGGCTNEESEIQPTPVQKALFQELVQKILSISQQYAVQSQKLYEQFKMDKLFQWSVENSESSNETPQTLNNLDPEIIDHILGKSDAVRMKEIVEIVLDPKETVDSKENALDDLEMLVEQIDNANDIENMNLWPKILSFLSLPEASLRKHAIWVCGTAVQNNIRAQKAFTDKGGLKILMDILKDSHQDDEVRSKALYAISGTIKHNAPALAQFEKDGGYDVLLSLLATSDDLSILRKTVFLFNTLLIQDPTVATTQIKEKSINKQFINLLNKHGSGDEDLVDKIFRTFLAEFQHSLSLTEDEVNELKNILPVMKKKYGDNFLSSTEWAELESKIQ
ncbi:14313_t:CDS:10 [Acaulospora morrowiae]|uniref:14313_t:CDS:1 n=1 Tax=Acaulospora morrowiae TaxID=94023 RepID=A0A9N8W7H8_9GLOM|nr:14313_t:CDS:10 [Acaulospora morrowiae]